MVKVDHSDYIWASDISRGYEAAKFTKTPKMPRNSIKNLIKYMSVQHFETYFSYWGYLLALNLQIYLETSSLKQENNVLKLPDVIRLRKTGHLPDVKGFAIGSFPERIVVERANDNLC